MPELTPLEKILKELQKHKFEIADGFELVYPETWEDAKIFGVFPVEVPRRHTSQGWLTELYREDGAHVTNCGTIPSEVYAQFQMAYASFTPAELRRGPHLHYRQADYFVFLQGELDVFLWDFRPKSSTQHVRDKIRVVCDKDTCTGIYVPPGVAHAYVAKKDALLVNFTSELYAGWRKLDPVDEVRLEEQLAAVELQKLFD